MTFLRVRLRAQAFLWLKQSLGGGYRQSVNSERHDCRGHQCARDHECWKNFFPTPQVSFQMEVTLKYSAIEQRGGLLDCHMCEKQLSVFDYWE